MTDVTLAIALVACFFVVFLRPSRALAVYIMSMLLYPSYLVIQLGVFDVSVRRFVVAVLLLKCLANSKLRSSFKWNRHDTWVLYYMIVSTVIPLISHYVPIARTLENKAGSLMNTFLAYLVARLCITDRASIVTVLKWVSIAFIPLALIGIIEACTGWRAYFALMEHCPWGIVVHIKSRSGFFRAIGPFNHPTMFGASLVLFLPLIYSLRLEYNFKRQHAYILAGIVIIGILSTMSSGPYMMVVLLAGCLILEHHKQLIKPILIWVPISCFLVDIVSNRTFYHVIASYANPLGGTSWHRAKLIDLAIERFGEWWLFGYRGLDPGWGDALGMSFTDVTNQYIVCGILNGMLGVIIFSGMLIVSLISIVRLYKSTSDPAVRSWSWAFGSLIVTLMIAFFSCSIFGQTTSLFYCVLGMIGSLTSSAFSWNKLLLSN